MRALGAAGEEQLMDFLAERCQEVILEETRRERESASRTTVKPHVKFFRTTGRETGNVAVKRRKARGGQ